MLRSVALFETRERCPVCDMSNPRPLLDLSFDQPPISTHLDSFYEGGLDPGVLSSGRYSLNKCDECGLIYQRDVPTPSLLKLVYETAARDPEVPRGRGLKVRQGYSFQVEQILKYWTDPPDQVEVLDHGAGSGDWLDMAGAYGCKTYAIELSRTRKDLLTRRGRTILEPDELPNNRFHFINSEQVFEHLVDPMAELCRLSSALRPRGLVRISVPNGSGVEDLLGAPDWMAPKGSPRSLNAVAPLEHINCFNHRSLKTLGSNAGLQSFVYPARQYLDSWERIRFVASALKHKIKAPKGTLLIFQKLPAD